MFQLYFTIFGNFSSKSRDASESHVLKRGRDRIATSILSPKEGQKNFVPSSGTFYPGLHAKFTSQYPPPLPKVKTRMSEAPQLLVQKLELQKSSIIGTALRSLFKDVLPPNSFKKELLPFLSYSLPSPLPRWSPRAQRPLPVCIGHCSRSGMDAPPSRERPGGNMQHITI